ncbi:phospholipase A2-like isoform X2 [Mesocricetus auratus]|uniref:Phospholipase A2 n=1 Tax=Mesocricetus auratus TaxID=10036 RepID=A0A1U7QTY0_MESAU|nr:phospholipase A2-like isoform X2 [Mesocricetus auratus]
MKLLLLVTLITGATAQSISPRAVWQFGNVFQCNIPLIQRFMEYNFYCWYCLFDGWNHPMEDIDRCCRARANCYAQGNNMKNCNFRLGDLYTTSYSYSCSGAVVTCNEENDACAAFICNCDRQAAICFSNTTYSKDFSGDYC